MARLWAAAAVIACVAQAGFAEEGGLERRFEKAFFKENYDRDVEAALLEYRSIAESGGADRALVSRCDLRIGLCLEKLGRKDEAEKALRKAAESESAAAEVREEASKALARMGGKGEGAGKRASTDEAVRAALEKKISIDAKDMPIAELLDFIAETRGISIVLDRGVRTLENSGATVNISVAEIETKSALSLATKLHGLAWDVMHGVVFVSTEERLRGCRGLKWYGSQGPPEKAGPEEAKILATLENTMLTVDFLDTPLEAVVGFLRSVSGLNIVIDWRGEAPKDPPLVTLKVADLPAGNILRLFLMPLNLEYLFEDGVLKIAPRRPQPGSTILAAEGRGTYRQDVKIDLEFRPALRSAVAAGLGWLLRHQNADGTWSCAKFSRNCKGKACSGAGEGDMNDMGVTGLALLALLGSGSSIAEGPYKDAVSKAAMGIMLRQDSDGCIGRGAAAEKWIYGHAICTLALAECAGMSGEKEGMLFNAARKAADFLVLCQNPAKGWRYGLKPGDNDTSCTAWATLALKSARLAGIHVPLASGAGARRWFISITDPETGRAGYISRGDSGARPFDPDVIAPSNEAMTAASIACRILLGERRDSPDISKGAGLILECLPKYDVLERTVDMYYWYFGTLAMFQVGEGFKAWADATAAALLPNQHGGKRSGEGADPGGRHVPGLAAGEPCLAGSFDPDCVWGKSGGRVYSTAICTLILEILERAGK